MTTQPPAVACPPESLAGRAHRFYPGATAPPPSGASASRTGDNITPDPAYLRGQATTLRNQMVTLGHDLADVGICRIISTYTTDPVRFGMAPRETRQDVKTINHDEQWLDVTAAREYLGCSRWLLWDRIRRGELPYTSDPLDRRRRLIRRADLEALKTITTDKEAA